MLLLINFAVSYIWSFKGTACFKRIWYGVRISWSYWTKVSYLAMDRNWKMANGNHGNGTLDPNTTDLNYNSSIEFKRFTGRCPRKGRESRNASLIWARSRETLSGWISENVTSWSNILCCKNPHIRTTTKSFEDKFFNFVKTCIKGQRMPFYIRWKFYNKDLRLNDDFYDRFWLRDENSIVYQWTI